MTKGLNRFLEKHINKIIISTLIWIFFAPIILTQLSSFISFDDTGQIGDTIGGITAPAIGLVSSLLLYLALIKQIDSNNSSKHEANFRIIYNELEKFDNQLTIMNL